MIPHRFHFVFGLKRQPEPLHLVHYLCLASCIGVNAPDAVYFYYHHEPHGRYWDLIRERIIPVRIPRVSFIDGFRYADRRVARYQYAHASDLVRLEKIVRYGGVYADMDTLFVNPVPVELWDKPFVLGQEKNLTDPVTRQSSPSVCNAFIMAERNAEFGKLWLQALGQAFDGTWSNHSTLLPRKLASRYPELVHLEPAHTFYKHMWTREGIHTLLEGLDTDYRGVVSMHLWAHLWWSPLRRDFSTFHAGKLTEEFVRHKDTTYSVAARQFLPPPETRSFVVRQQARVLRQTQPLQDVAREAGMKAYILTKLAAFSIIHDNLVPRAAEHLDYAKRQWAHSYPRSRFRPRNRFEERTIFADVALWDSYGINKMHFAPGDVVLDIGAHVGIVSYMCYLRGSRAILAFEPEVKNFERLARHVGDLEGIEPANLAVFRSDQPVGSALAHSGYDGENTGGGSVMFAGGLVETFLQEMLTSDAPLQPVDVIALDEILAQVGHVSFLKLDCEGSEFPILLTSRLLERVERIVGEYHEMTAPVFAALDPRAQIDGYTEYRVEDLVVCLERAGFQVNIKPSAPYMGIFSATRKTTPQ